MGINALLTSHELAKIDAHGKWMGVFESKQRMCCFHSKTPPSGNTTMTLGQLYISGSVVRTGDAGVCHGFGCRAYFV